MAARNVSMDWTTKRSVSATRLRESGLVTSVRGVSTSARMKKAPARAAAQPLARVSWDGEMRLPPCALASWRTMLRPDARRVRRLYKRSSRLPLLRRNLQDDLVNKDKGNHYGFIGPCFIVSPVLGYDTMAHAMESTVVAAIPKVPRARRTGFSHRVGAL